jgi:hypothetical protein
LLDWPGLTEATADTQSLEAFLDEGDLLSTPSP